MNKNSRTDAFVVELVVNSRKNVGTCVVGLLAIRLEGELAELL
jgi:hypothetical protein